MNASIDITLAPRVLTINTLSSDRLYSYAPGGWVILHTVEAVKDATCDEIVAAMTILMVTCWHPDADCGCVIRRTVERCDRVPDHPYRWMVLTDTVVRS